VCCNITIGGTQDAGCLSCIGAATLTEQGGIRPNAVWIGRRLCHYVLSLLPTVFDCQL